MMWIAGFALLGSAVLLAACAPLSAYNALTPADTGAAVAERSIAYGAHPRQKLDVYVPSGSAGGRPIAVVFYGGSWNSGHKEDYAFLGKALASRGIVAVVADYRLVPEVRFPDFVEDGAIAVLWAHKNAARFSADPNRLFLFGHSAGAYNAAMIALDPRYLARLGSSRSIVKGVAALAGPYDFLPLDKDVAIEAFGRTANLASTQPINFVSRDAPAMLLVTGTDDTTVFPRNTFALADKLKGNGAPVTVRTYPGIGHVGILLAMSVALRGRAPVLDDVSDFILKRP
jgi:acetyl esterase/lipase